MHTARSHWQAQVVVLTPLVHIVGCVSNMDKPPKSRLALELLLQFANGTLAGTQVQSLAAAAYTDGWVLPRELPVFYSGRPT